MPTYLGYNDLKEFLIIDPSLNFKLVKTDTYDEEKVRDSIIKTKMVEELKCCAVQTALVGTGRNVLGSVMIKELEVSVKQVYKDAGIKVDLPPTSKLDEGDLTPRRLQRFFRYTIHEFMNNHKVSSYLYTKYSDHNDDYKYEIFPGCEHMVEDQSIAKYLYKTYLRLDFQLNTNISDRIYRVLLTRGILSMKAMDEMKMEMVKIRKELDSKSF